MDRTHLESFLESRSTLFHGISVLFQGLAHLPGHSPARTHRRSRQPSAILSLAGGAIAQACINLDKEFSRVATARNALGSKVEVPSLAELHSRMSCRLALHDDDIDKTVGLLRSGARNLYDSLENAAAYLGFIDIVAQEAKGVLSSDGDSGRLRRMLALQLAFDCGAMGKMLDMFADWATGAICPTSPCGAALELANWVSRYDAILLGDHIGVSLAESIPLCVDVGQGDVTCRREETRAHARRSALAHDLP